MIAVSKRKGDAYPVGLKYRRKAPQTLIKTNIVDNFIKNNINYDTRQWDSIEKNNKITINWDANSISGLSLDQTTNLVRVKNTDQNGGRKININADVSSNDPLTQTDEMTMCFTLRVSQQDLSDSSNWYPILYTHTGDGDNGFVLARSGIGLQNSLLNGKLNFELYGGVIENTFTHTSLNLNTNLYLCLVYSNNLKIYCNGVLIGTINKKESSWKFSDIRKIHLGQQQKNTKNSNFLVGDIQFYNRALLDWEIKQNYNFTSGVNYVLKTEDNLVKVRRVGSNIIKFPQKNFLILDLDAIVFMQNRFQYSVKEGTFEVWNAGTKLNNFGNIIQSDPGTSGYFINTKQKYWYIGSRGYTNIVYGVDLLSSRKCTISITFKCRGNPLDWRDLWWFNNADQFRCEWNPLLGGWSLFGENELLPRTPNFSVYGVKNYANITVVVNQRNLKGYLNGVQNFELTMNRDLIAGLYKIYFAVQRGQSGGFLGTDMFIRDIRLWNTNLSNQEILDLQNFVYIN